MSDDRQVESFVFTVLDQIRTGIENAQHASKGGSFKVNPDGVVLKDQSGVLSISENGVVCTKVSFDMSVTVESGTDVDGGLKLSLFGQGLSAAGKKSNKGSTVHKVTFFVPVEFPSATGE